MQKQNTTIEKVQIVESNLQDAIWDSTKKDTATLKIADSNYLLQLLKEVEEEMKK